MRHFLILCISTVFLSALAQNKPDTGAPSGKPTEATEAEQALRAYLQLQEQLHSAMLTIEQARKDAEAAAQRNQEAIRQARQESEAAAQRSAEIIGARLKLIEQTLTSQQEHEMKAMHESNHVVLTIAAIVATIGFLGKILTAFCLWRALARVAQITASLQPFPGLTQQLPAALANPDGPYVTLTGAEMSSTRLLGAIERLEKRIHDLEHTAVDKLDDIATVDVQETKEPQEPVSKPDRAIAEIDKGQALLTSNRPDKALVCFEEALKLDPDNTDALVKKGAALEHLKRFEEAIECYDRAIAANRGMTVAYLHKGAVCNQLERFSEALECYEQALRTQQKTVAT
jgi:tetratricopeptide (TPR) repeat protein